MRTFFTFSRYEWVGSIFLLLLILGSFFFRFFLKISKKDTIDLAEYRMEVEKFLEEQSRLDDSSKAAAGRKGQFYRAQQSKFGEYGSKSDFYTGWPQDTLRKEKGKTGPKYRIIKTELNRCDSSDIMRIPYFGSKRASKMMEYRDKLGGFYRLEQLHEIYIIKDISLEYLQKYFTLDTALIRKIAVNHSSYQELIAHPYLDAYLCKTILHHRKKHGDINDLEELGMITHAYPELLEKLRPYLSFEK